MEASCVRTVAEREECDVAVSADDRVATIGWKDGAAVGILIDSVPVIAFLGEHRSDVALRVLLQNAVQLSVFTVSKVARATVRVVDRSDAAILVKT